MSAAPLIHEEEIRRETRPVTRPSQQPSRPNLAPTRRVKPKARSRGKAQSRRRTDPVAWVVFGMIGVTAYLLSGLVGYSMVERTSQSLKRMERQTAEARYDLQRRESLAFLAAAPARLSENARREGFTSPQIQEEDRRNEEAQAELAKGTTQGEAATDGSQPTGEAN